MRRVALLLPLLRAAVGADFQPLSCGSTFAGGCSHTNTGGKDQAVSLFFQYEPTNSEAGSLKCTGDDLTYCSRSWTGEASGSAGDCYFLLGAGRSFSCTGGSNVNIIGAHAVDMATAVVGTGGSVALPCTGSSGCTYTAKGADAWVGLAFESAATGDISCKYGAMEVCGWAVNAAGGGGSCNFLLPKGAELKCEGAATVTSAQALAFSRTVLDKGAPLEESWKCPNTTYPLPNLCDCDYTNPYADKDLAVSVVSSSVDANFNSFHCGYDGVNVCAWGSNRNDKNDRGGCYFILPAGKQFSCQMEWGAAAFSFSAAAATKEALFEAGSIRRKGSPLKGVRALPGRTTEELRGEFRAWQVQHNRSYSTVEEEKLRFSNFVEHVSIAGRKLRYNNLADLSRHEFERFYKGAKPPPRDPSVPVWAPPAETLPTAVDWRTKGVVTAVKDQGQCGSCWSFSTTGVIESAWAIAGYPLVSLSEQELVSCDSADGNEGCGGGWPYRAIDYVVKNGIDTEASYPYTSGGGKAPKCVRSGHTKAPVQVEKHLNIASKEETMAQYVAQHGPLSICVAAMTQLWWPYTGGIMTGCCNTDCDHAVLIVGYGEEKGTKFWIIKNSWSSTWGEDGYLRLERGTNQCGIESNPVAAIIAGSASPTPAPLPTPAPPTPRPTPVPPPGACPPQAVSGPNSCSWVNGTKGVILPPASVIQEYCDYFSSGYFGYLWPKGTPSSFPCPDAADSSSSTDSLFCIFRQGDKAVVWPSGAKADCSKITAGTIGYSW